MNGEQHYSSSVSLRSKGTSIDYSNIKLLLLCITGYVLRR